MCGRPGGFEKLPLIQSVTVAAVKSSTIDNIGKNRVLANLNEPETDSPIENPGALAGATGADTKKKACEHWPNLNPFIAASHPIIALHWGIEA